MIHIYISLILTFGFSACHTTTTTASNLKETKHKTKKTKTEILEIASNNQNPKQSVENIKIDSQNTPVAIEKVFNHNSWHNLLQKHVSNQGNVNYKGFKNDYAQLNEYIMNLSNNVPNTTTTKEQRLAYWINAYNALTVDLILKNLPVKSIKDIKNPWDQKLWTLGGEVYNLNKIEHEILRKMDEPRIHFAIVCASFSCPKLSNEAYLANNIETQLTKATKDFLEDPLRNNLSKNDIKISKIFKWFAKDFKKNGSIIDFINKFASITIDKNANKKFKDYNWTLNE